MATDNHDASGNYGAGGPMLDIPYSGAGSGWRNQSIIEGFAREQFEKDESPDDTIAHLEVRPGTSEREMQIEGVSSSLPMITVLISPTTP